MHLPYGFDFCGARPHINENKKNSMPAPMEILHGLQTADAFPPFPSEQRNQLTQHMSTSRAAFDSSGSGMHSLLIIWLTSLQSS